MYRDIIDRFLPHIVRVRVKYNINWVFSNSTLRASNETTLLAFGGKLQNKSEYSNRVMEIKINDTFQLQTGNCSSVSSCSKSLYFHVEDTFKGPPMPKKLVYHCAISFGNVIYIHGGFERPDIPNYDTFIFNLDTKSWKVTSDRPNCGKPKAYRMTTCAQWNRVYMVVAAFDVTTEKSCTAILNVETERWTKLDEDNRFPVAGGYLLKQVLLI